MRDWSIFTATFNPQILAILMHFEEDKVGVFLPLQQVIRSQYNIQIDIILLGGMVMMLFMFTSAATAGTVLTAASAATEHSRRQGASTDESLSRGQETSPNETLPDIKITETSSAPDEYRKIMHLGYDARQKALAQLISEIDLDAQKLRERLTTVMRPQGK